MKTKKIIVSILVVVLLFAFAMPTFAATYSFDKPTKSWRFPGESNYVQAIYVTGGDSQRMVENKERKEKNSMDVHIDKLDLNGQSNFRFRGYQGNDPCTYARKITKTGFNGAKYLTPKTGNQICDLLMSIASSNTNDRVYFVGRWAI